MWFRGLSQAHAGAEAVDDKEADKMTSLSPPPDSSMSALSTLCRLWLGDVWERMGLEEEAVEDRERTASKVRGERTFQGRGRTCSLQAQQS